MFAIALADNASLRPLEPWQAAEFAELVDRIRPHLLPWIPFAARIVDTDTARTALQRFADLQSRDEGRMFGIWVDGVLSGGTIFRTFSTATGVCEVGVWLAPEAEGRGLMTAAVRHMIDWAFRERGLSRVEWMCDPRNGPSKALAKRLGMTYEGTMRSSFVIGGERCDSEVWAVLVSDWPA